MFYVSVSRQAWHTKRWPCDGFGNKKSLFWSKPARTCVHHTHVYLSSQDGQCTKVGKNKWSKSLKMRWPSTKTFLIHVYRISATVLLIANFLESDTCSGFKVNQVCTHQFSHHSRSEGCMVVASEISWLQSSSAHAAGLEIKHILVLVRLALQAYVLGVRITVSLRSLLHWGAFCFCVRAGHLVSNNIRHEFARASEAWPQRATLLCRLSKFREAIYFNSTQLNQV